MSSTSSCIKLRVEFSAKYGREIDDGYVCVKILFLTDDQLNKHLKTITSRIEKDLNQYFDGYTLQVFWETISIIETTHRCNGRFHYILNGSGRFVNSYKKINTMKIHYKDIEYAKHYKQGYLYRDESDTSYGSSDSD